MKVAVIEPDGRVLATYEVVVGGINYAPTEADAFKEAKRNAIEDGLVNKKDADKLTFKVVS